MVPHYASCVVRFRNPHGEACGTGFLIDRHHVMTCAHVVNVALGRELKETARPAGSLCLELPLAQDNGPIVAEAKVATWHAPVAYAHLRADQPSDMAVLQLAAEQPNAAVAHMAAGNPDWGRAFRTFGFPVEHGQPADGETMERDAGGWVHLRQTRDYGHLVKQGFSGAPVFAADDNTVLGMIVAVDTSDGSRIAYGEPLRRLQLAWPQMARPYKGLARFEPADSDFFFGRESVTRRCLARIENKPLTLLVGPSGGGKSSLVFGGIVPRLDERWGLIRFRPGNEPITNLAWSASELLMQPGNRSELMNCAGELTDRLLKDPAALFKAARALGAGASGKRVLVIADQFEELFTLCKDEDQKRAIYAIVAAIGEQRAPAPVTLVATLRADFFGDVLSSPLSQVFKNCDVPLWAMTAVELGRAIRLPAEHFGVHFDDDVYNDLFAAVAKDAAALPLMEFALEQLWAEQQDRYLTSAAYRGIGGLEGALTRYADSIIDAMDETDRTSARRLLCRLVNVARPGEGEDTKRPQSHEELGELWPMAQRLAGQSEGQPDDRPARLVVLYRDEQGHEVADLVHEALIRHWQRLRDWLTKEERSFRLLVDELQRARRRWERECLDERLLRGRDLTEALAQRERLAAEHPELRALIDASEEHELEVDATRRADAIWEPLEFLDGELTGPELDFPHFRKVPNLSIG